MVISSKATYRTMSHSFVMMSERRCNVFIIKWWSVRHSLKAPVETLEAVFLPAPFLTNSFLTSYSWIFGNMCLLYLCKRTSQHSDSIYRFSFDSWHLCQLLRCDGAPKELICESLATVFNLMHSNVFSLRRKAFLLSFYTMEKGKDGKKIML